jgi:hypothetical protein
LSTDGKAKTAANFEYGVPFESRPKFHATEEPVRLSPKNVCPPLGASAMKLPSWPFVPVGKFLVITDLLRVKPATVIEALTLMLPPGAAAVGV